MCLGMCHCSLINWPETDGQKDRQLHDLVVNAFKGLLSWLGQEKQRFSSRFENLSI